MTQPDRLVVSFAESAAARVLARPRLTHDQALVCLARVFTGASPGALLADLDHASRPLFGAAGHDLGLRADALATLLSDDLGLVVERADHRSLLLDHVLAERRAHPLAYAALGVELARRAGLASLVAMRRGEPWIVLTQEQSCTLIGPHDHPEDVRVEQLRGCCAHEVAWQTLDAIAERAPDDVAARAIRLRDRVGGHASECSE